MAITSRIYKCCDKLSNVTTPDKPFGVQVFEDGYVQMWDAFPTKEEARRARDKFVDKLVVKRLGKLQEDLQR